MKWTLIITLYFTDPNSGYKIQKYELEKFPTRKECVEQIIPTIREWEANLERGTFKLRDNPYRLPAGVSQGTYRVECRDQDNRL